MPSIRAYLGPDMAHGAAELGLALAIRDSEMPVPIATSVDAEDYQKKGPSLRDAGIFGQILAAISLTLVAAFLFIVAKGP